MWIQGINPPGYNASDVTVTACSGNTISYANTTTASYGSGGFLTDENGFGAYSVMVNISGSVSATNITITNNTIHDCHFCLYGGATAGQTLSNVSVTNNTFYNMDHGIAWFDNNDGLSTWNGTNIFAGNTYYDWANWDCSTMTAFTWVLNTGYPVCSLCSADCTCTTIISTAIPARA